MHSQLITFVLTASVFVTGCAATIDQSGVEQRTSQAIGRSVGQFTITDRTQDTGGRVNYTARTRDGETYSCYLYGATGFQKAMSFGQTPHSDAICTPMVDGQGRAGKPGAAPSEQPHRNAGKACNALQRAANRC